VERGGELCGVVPGLFGVVGGTAQVFTLPGLLDTASVLC